MNTHQADKRDDMGDTLARLFHPGPLDWLLKLTPPRSRFQPGRHLHGLAEHDIEVPRDPRSDPSR